MSIKRSVSFYSYQEAYYKGERTLEDLIRFTGEALKAEGIEILAEQTPVGRFPDPTDVDVERWKGWMEKYNTKPSCLDSFIDWNLYKNRTLTLKEQVLQMERDIRLAKRLGFPVIRVLCPVRKEVVEASIPIAEYYGVKMGLEVHTPMTLTARWIVEYMDMVVKSGSKYVGIIPDFGIFMMRPAKRQLDKARSEGARDEILSRIVSWCEAHIPFAEMMAKANALGANSTEMAVVQSFARNVFTHPDELRDFAPFIFHCHGKFYDMDDDCLETSIDYENPIRVLKDIGYEGYISSEFEGQRLYGDDEVCDEFEQVRRHQAMLKRIIEG